MRITMVADIAKNGERRSATAAIWYNYQSSQTRTQLL